MRGVRCSVYIISITMIIVVAEGQTRLFCLAVVTSEFHSHCRSDQLIHVSFSIWCAVDTSISVSSVFCLLWVRAVECFGCGASKKGKQLLRDHVTAQPEAGSDMGRAQARPTPPAQAGMETEEPVGKESSQKTSPALTRQTRGTKRRAPRGRAARGGTRNH